MAMDLEAEFTLDLELEAPLMTPGAPYGTRAVVPCTGGRAEGRRINGTVVGPSGDWALLGPDGWGRLDVRLHIQTEDGAVLYMTYGGIMEMNDAVMSALLTPGQQTQFGDQYYRIQPRLETGDERYSWVNRSVFLGQGRVTGAGVEYEVLRVT
jgi:hypothetical protein